MRIIRDCRDATRDYFLPYAVAKQLYLANKLAFDLTNSCYCHLPAEVNHPKKEPPTCSTTLRN
jgi:hypothetical protein